MLIQSSFCSSMETSLFRESEYENLTTYDWVPKTETCRMFHKLSEHPQSSSLNYSVRDEMRTDDSCEVNAERKLLEQSTDRTPDSALISLVYSRRKQRRKRTDDTCEVNAERNCSEQSTTDRKTPDTAPVSLVYSRRKQRRKTTVPKETRMHQDSPSCKVSADNNCSEQSTTDRTPNSAPVSFVYSRSKRRRKTTVPKETRMDQDSPSVINSAVASVAEIDQDGVKQAKPEIKRPEEALTVPVSKLACYQPLKRVGFSGEGINDGCSSFKSYKNTRKDEAGECSSSGFIGEDISARDFCVSILRNNGLLERGWPSRNCNSVEEEIGLVNSNSSNQLCKVCGQSEAAARMLICDQCEEAFHKHCCNTQKKKTPCDEWFCSSCSKQKRKFFKDTSRRRQTRISGRGKRKSVSTKREANLILKMLRDSYISRVRIGANFQAEVPDWSDSTPSVDSLICEPEEMDPSECMHELNAGKPCRRLGLIGNWLQCRAEGFDGTIYGNWRRAPLCEAQTADWECFDCICWDPSRADCAVPQELETDEIMKQVKYIEMLRPQLDAKRRKVKGRRDSGSEKSNLAKA